MTESAVAERESSGDAQPALSRRGLIAGLASLLLAIEAAAALIVLFNLPRNIVSTLTSDRALHALVSPDGRHTLIIQNDSFLLLGQHTVHEKVGGVMYEERGEITTDNGYDPFGLSTYAVNWGLHAVTITYFDYHRYMTLKIPLNSKT